MHGNVCFYHSVFRMIFRSPSAAQIQAIDKFHLRHQKNVIDNESVT